MYISFHGFGQAKFAYDVSILGSSQFTLLPQLPLKTMLSLKVIKMIIFESILTTFKLNVAFWGSCENWLDPEIKQP